MRALVAVVLPSLCLLMAACAGSKKPAATPTFTPAPSATAAAAGSRPPPAHPVVASECLRGLSSYRFGGSFSLRGAATPAPSGTATGGESGGLSGSLANLLSNVTFQGEALAPDRYHAQVTFGGGGIQPLEVIRIGDQTFSRFGTGQWQSGDQIRGLGGISQFDPQTLCQNLLVSLDAGGQSPAHETVNGVPSLRYQIQGPQVARALRGAQGGGGGGGGGGGRGGAARGPSATAAPSDAQLTVWAAEKGGYPVRFQLSGGSGASAIDLLVNVTDVNSKDIQINPPS